MGERPGTSFLLDLEAGARMVRREEVEAAGWMEPMVAGRALAAVWLGGWIEGRRWLARDGSGRIPRWEASGWMAGGGDETDGTNLLKIRVGLVYI